MWNDAKEVNNYVFGIQAQVNTKYKSLVKKIKFVAIQLPAHSKDHIKQAKIEPRLRNLEEIGHWFTKETLKKLKIEGGEFLTELKRFFFF